MLGNSNVKVRLHNGKKVVGKNSTEDNNDKKTYLHVQLILFEIDCS